MSLDLANYQAKARTAVRAFWRRRQGAQRKQRSAAFREGAFEESSQPFLGWLMLLEDCEESRRPVQAKSPHFEVFPEFKNASYADRYNLLCRKLLQEQLYTSACLLLSPRNAAGSGALRDYGGTTSLLTFVSTLAGRVAVEAARTS